MSVADFKKYGQMIAEREEVRAQAKTIGMNNLAGQIAYAKTLGLEFSVADVTSLAKQAGATSNELSDAQLEQVAGGVFTTTAALVGAVAGAVGAAAGAVSIGVAVGSESSRNW